MSATNPNAALHLPDRSIMLIFLVGLLALTGGGFVYERARNAEAHQARFEVVSGSVSSDIAGTMAAYGQVLQSGAAFMQASPRVSRDDWRTFVLNLELKERYPAIQGVGYNPIISGPLELAAFEREMESAQLGDFMIRPAGIRETYVPVLYLEPQTPRNVRAYGFDIYSERNRRDAIVEAIATDRPSLTAKITLVQEDPAGGDDQVQSGVLLMQPVHPAGALPGNGDTVTGFVVGVFRMGDLIEDIVNRNRLVAGSSLTVTVFDGDRPTAETLLYQSPHAASDRYEPRHFTTTQIALFNRVWTFQTASTPAFEELATERSHYIVLIGGVVLSALLTSLLATQFKRQRLAVATATRLAASHDQIETLMGEVNHRSKNLLSLVQAMARQTSAGDPKTFSATFSQRLAALASSQDLLVKSKWKNVGLEALIMSQLAHFQGLIGTRITLTGPAVPLFSHVAQTLGMAVHELATNAGKYGALSDDKGRIDIVWDVSESTGDFVMTWSETGGPAVTQPQQTGFGTRVTCDMVRMSLAAQVETTFTSGGVTWRMSCPAAKIVGKSKT